MIYNRFRFVVATRVLLLGGTMLMFFWLLLRTELYVTVALAGVAIGVQVYGLIRYVEKTNRDLKRFLQSVRYEDFSQTFSGRRLGYSFEELYDAFSEVMAAFKRARAAEEANYRYLQTVVHHIGVGLIVFTRDGRVELLNTAAKRLLQITHLKNIHALESSYPQLVDTLFQLPSGEKALLKLDVGGERMELAMYATSFKLQSTPFTLVSLQNIGGELEEKEMEAWQNLTRVLAHEIMNSVTPIASLAGTVNGLLSEPVFDAGATNGHEQETLEDVRGAVQTIEKRSQGLLHFVDAYRNLARIPRPSFEMCPVGDLFGGVERLMRSRLADSPIRFSTAVDPASLQILADPELIEQVLINLVKNAIEALDDRPDGRIELTAGIDERGKAIIQLTDNGPGLTPEQIEKVFVPFFTTKPEGSGIGLSFSRRIMRMHGGTLRVHSRPGKRTTFTLRF